MNKQRNELMKEYQEGRINGFINRLIDGMRNGYINELMDGGIDE